MSIGICRKCGKLAYSKREALTAKNSRWKEDRVSLRIYPCGKAWHLTKLRAEEWIPTDRANSESVLSSA